MNYGKQSAAKQAARLKASNKKIAGKLGLLLLRIMLIAFITVVGVVGYTVFKYANDLIATLPDASTIDITPTGYLSTVYDRDGNEIETLASSGANRTYVTIKEIPKDLQHAFVAIEDERFYTHNGIDMKGIIRAGVQGVASGFHFSQGASTITQQLLKNNYFTTWTSETTKLDKVNRKIQEQYLAVQLEKITSKDTILENYLNTINLGQNTLGVEAASQRYFNKTVSELTLSECAVIAGITQNPSKYNPITHPEYNAERREKVLKNMLDQSYISEKEYKEALKDDVYDRIAIVNNDTLAGGSTSYFVDALTDQVIDDLMEKLDYSEAEAYQLLYAGGLSIYGTQDSNIQEILDEEINDVENYNGHERYSFSYRLTVNKADGTTANYSEQTMLIYYQAKKPSYSINFKTIEDAQEAIDNYRDAVMEEGDTVSETGETVTFTLQPQAAMTIIDQSTGEVMALCGGRGEKIAAKTLNRATGITRQPGSTFKVLAAFAPALDAGGMTLATVQDDAPMTYENGTELKDYDKKYQGYTSIRWAITKSINVVTVKTLTEIGTGLGYQYVKNFGISTLTDGDNCQSLALGGITRGVTNLELTAAYATIANEGNYNKPHFYTQVLDHAGNVILDNTTAESTPVLKRSTAWLLTNAMQDVMTVGTGTPANFKGMTVAGKSGTTTKNRDTVFAGFTPYYTAVVWGGYDDNTPQDYTTYSKVIWKKVMSRIHEDLENRDFPKPDDIVTAVICKKSGKLAIEGVCDCDPRGSMVTTEYFAEGTEPTEYCDTHFVGHVCSESHMMARSGCPYNSGVFIISDSTGTEEEFMTIHGTDFGVACTSHWGEELNPYQEYHAPEISIHPETLVQTITEDIDGIINDINNTDFLDGVGE